MEPLLCMPHDPQTLTDSPERNDMLEAMLVSTDAIQRLWKAYFFAKLDELGDWKLTPSQLLALRTVGLHGRMNSRTLGGLLHVTPGAVTQLVDSLVADGYVLRQQDADDRRMTNLAVSPLAEVVLADVDQVRRTVFADIFSVLTDDELAAMATIHDKILDQLGGMQAPADSVPDGQKDNQTHQGETQ